MSQRFTVCRAVAVALVSVFAAVSLSLAGSKPAASPTVLFDGTTLAGWVNVNGAPQTWQVRDGMLVGSGAPAGFLRTEAMYENFVLEVDWRLVRKGGTSGLLIHADALPHVGSPDPRAVEIRIADGDHGSITGIHGCTLTPLTQPLEDRCRPAGEWNHYVVTAKDGALDLEVNGKVVTRVKGCSQVKGYIGLKSAGSEIHFRNVRITPLTSANPPAGKVARADEGLRSLFDGVSFQGWQHPPAFAGHWVARDGVIACDGQVKFAKGQTKDLWTEKEYRNLMLMADWRLPMKPEPKALPTFTPDGLFVRDGQGKVVRKEIQHAGDSGIHLRGNPRYQVNIWSQPMGSGDINDLHKDASLPIEIRRACVPKKRADAPFGEWNRFLITLRGDRVTVVLNGEVVIDRAGLPGIAARGRIGLQNHGDPVEFRNLFLRELE
jgi:hypothetical protein